MADTPLVDNESDQARDAAAGGTSPPDGAKEEAKAKKQDQPKKSPNVMVFGPDQPKDSLESRYDIQLDSPLPHLDSRHAKAFEVKDGKNARRPMYALVTDNHYPVRINELLACTDIQDLRFLKPVAASVANLSGNFGCRYVTVHEQPSGQSIATLMKRGHKFTEKSVIKDLILPLHEVIGMLQERKVLHGHVCTDTIFYNESGNGVTQLLECFTDPVGSAQSYYFEPLDRAQAHPYAKGDNDFKADFFGLGVVTLHMLLGFNPVANLSQDEYFDKLMAQGSYNTLVGNREFSGMMDDLLKGLLADHPDDRWGMAQLQKWLGGKKFNLLRPSLPREAPRPYLYQDVPYFNRKHLAYQLCREWSNSKSEMRDKKLSRWVELSIKRPDLAEKMVAIIQMTGGETGRLATDDDDLITKSLSLMDPLGPLRLQQVSLHVSGIGNYYAHAMQEGKATSLQFFQRILDGDYLTTWMDGNENNYSFTAVEIVWHIDRVKSAFRQSSLGFGQERLLYELNPTLPCQSKMIEHTCSMSIYEVLMALNRCSIEIKRGHDPVDKHIAAYLLTKMKVYVEIGTRIEQFPAFRRQSTLKGLLILAQAQQKIGNPAFPELTRWAADRLRPVLEGLHSRTLRKEILDEMEKAVHKGQVGLVVRLINNPEIIQQDEDGFRRAKSRFISNARKIAELNRRGSLNERAEASGAKLSILIAYVMLTITLLRIISQSSLF
ncbi:hypothetical protein GC177_00675 [bacterium]|nr:hypothetical protein [bacterium]